MATTITLVTGTGSATYTVSTGARGPSGAGSSTWNDLTGTANHIPFDLTPTAVPSTIGTLAWSETEEALEMAVEGGAIALGKEVFEYYTNVSGTTMVDGDIVSVTNVSGNRTAVNLTDATDVDSSRAVIGMVTHGAANNGKVRVTKIGTVHSLNTDGLTEGAAIYVDPIDPGKWTQTRPTAPNHVVSIGIVQVAHAVNGIADVSPDHQCVTTSDIIDASTTLATFAQGALADSALQAASIKGVIVTKANGTRTAYPPSADTDTARGLALEAAFSAAIAGDTIDLSPGNYLVAKATSTVIGVATHYTVLAGMTIRLNGARLYHQTAFNGAVIFAADAVDGWSILGPGVIEGTSRASSGAAEMGVHTRSCRRWAVRDLTIRFFRGVGFQINNTNLPNDVGGYGTLKGSFGKLINCHIDMNNVGLSTGQNAELFSVVSCTFNQNLTACDLYAGATNFTACEVMWNTNHGLRIRNYGNSAHGSFVSGVIAHNYGFGIHMEATNNGFMIADSVIGADTNSSNKIESLGGGMIITGCIVDAPFYASATPTGSNRFSQNYMSGTLSVVTDLLAAERLKWIFDGNENATGPWAQNDIQIYAFADNTAALAGGLTAGRRYRNSSTNAISTVV